MVVLRGARRAQRQTALWLALGALAGLAAGLLPPLVVLAGLGAIALGVVVLAEPALMLVVMLALAPLKVLIATEAPGIPADLGQFALVGVVGVWLVQRATIWRSHPLPRSPIYLPLVGIIAAFSPSLFSAQAIGDWAADLVKWAEMVLLVLIVLDLGRGGRWQWIVFGAVWAGGLQALLGLYQYFGGSGAPHLWIADTQRFRAFGSYGQPNPFSAHMGLTLPLALGLGWGYGRAALSAWQSGERAGARAALTFFYLVSSGVLLAGLIASWGRGAWLGFGAALGVMVCLAPPRWWQALGVMVLTGALLAGAWSMGLVPAGIAARLASVASEFTGFRDVRGVPLTRANYAIVERLAHWQAALAMADAHPMIGVGLGNYAAAYPRYALLGWPEALGHAHNEYLTLLAETGVIGLAGYLAGWLVIVGWTLRLRRQVDRVRGGVVLGLLGVWTHLAVHSLVDKLIVNNLQLHLGVLLGVLALVLAERSASGGDEHSNDEAVSGRA